MYFQFRLEIVLDKLVGTWKVVQNDKMKICVNISNTEFTCNGQPVTSDGVTVSLLGTIGTFAGDNLIKWKVADGIGGEWQWEKQGKENIIS